MLQQQKKYAWAECTCASAAHRNSYLVLRVSSFLSGNPRGIESRKFAVALRAIRRRTGPMAPAWRMLHISRRAIPDLLLGFGMSKLAILENDTKNPLRIPHQSTNKHELGVQRRKANEAKFQRPFGAFGAFGAFRPPGKGTGLTPPSLVVT